MSPIRMIPNSLYGKWDIACILKVLLPTRDAKISSSKLEIQENGGPRNNKGIASNHRRKMVHFTNVINPVKEA